MRKPETPADEAQRLQALRSLDILDTPAEERFDRLTRIAQRLLQVPIVLVSLVDAQRQWFKSRQGLDATETPREISFCGHAILERKTFCIPDAAADERFADNPLVTGAPNIRFYAGVPLELPGGERVGTLCAIDRRPRELTADQEAVLRDLADCVTAELQLRPFVEVTRQLRDHEERLRAIFDNVIDGIVTTDAQGILQSANPAIERIFGYRAEELVGRNIRMLVPESHYAEFEDLLRHLLQTGRARVTGVGRETVARRKDGSVFPVEISAGAMQVQDRTMFTGIVRDISKRRVAEDRLREVSSLQQAILDSANFSIISTDKSGVIRTFNTGAQRMLGYTEEEAVGKMTPMDFHDPGEIAARARELARPTGRPVEPGFEAFAARAREGIVDVREWVYVRKDGSRFPALLSISALRDPSGEVSGYLGVASDITERKNIERMKSEFVSTVSHELRTPLTSIRGALSLVLAKAAAGLSDKARQLLETANRNSERLTLLINDILDLEKIESGRLDFELKELDLAVLANQAIAANEGFAHQHGVHLRLTEAPAHAEVRGDEHRLLQVFANLLSNAVKYSPGGGEVVVSIRSRDGHFRVGVRDRGRGIREEFRARVFQRFAQADSSDARDKGGTGLGLSITKAIVERLGGTIDYTTELGVGTEFFFELPQLHAAVLRAERRDGRPLMLICEDNPDVAAVLGEMLAQEGIASDRVGTAGAAREQLKATRYHGLLLDLGLPDMDGLSLIRELRHDAATRDLPVIVVSGRARETEPAWNGEALAVLDWLQKPVDSELLRRALAHALRVGRRRRILHVEDDLDIVQVTRSLVEDTAEYVYAVTLADARRELARAKFDLLLLDLALPDGSGIELLGEIGPETPVVVFSGTEPGSAISRQVAAALTKGRASNERLLATIKQIVNRDEA